MKKKELNSDFYNNAYLSKEGYSKHYSESPYKKMWLSIVNSKPLIDNVADFGCGTGQFANMCLDHGINYKFGVDFSEVAIEACKDLDAKFYCGDVYEDFYYSLDFDTAVILETLEHIENDKLVLDMIPKGKRIVFSVPNWDSVGHVRHFKSQLKIHNRYDKHLTIEKIDNHLIGKNGKIIFVVYGYK